MTTVRRIAFWYWLLFFIYAPIVFAQAPLDTLKQFRASYPAEMTPPETADLLNRVAWVHRGDGWGLLQKTGGFRCPLVPEIQIACDILIHQPTARHYDVLKNGGSESRPKWEDKGPCLKPPSGCSMDRFVAPIGSEPPPLPNPIPTPGPPIPTPGTDVLVILQRLEATLARLEPLIASAAHESFNAAVRALQLQTELPGKLETLIIVGNANLKEIREHRDETRKAWDTVRRVVFEYVAPLVAALLAGLRLGG